jgi:hypothetical protein
MILESLTNKIIKKIQIVNTEEEETDPHALLPLFKIRVFDSFHKTKNSNDLFIQKIKKDVYRKIRKNIMKVRVSDIQLEERLCLTFEVQSYFGQREFSDKRIIFDNAGYQGRIIPYLKHSSIENYFVSRYYKQIYKICRSEYRLMLQEVFMFLRVVFVDEEMPDGSDPTDHILKDEFRWSFYMGPDIIPLLILCYFPAPIYKLIYIFTALLIRYSQWELMITHRILAAQMAKLFGKHKELKANYYMFYRKIAKYLI